MKTFKQHIKEEWVDDSFTYGTVFKNPTPRELREYIDQLKYEDDVAGVLDTKSNDLYLFAGGLHANFMREYKINSGSAILFRGTARDKKIVRFSGSGDMKLKYNMSKEKDRQVFLDDMIKVYTHRSVQSAVEKDPKKALKFVGLEFRGHQKEYVSLMKARFGNKALGLKEEWVDHTPRTGDIFKNPTPREMAEYAKSLQFESDMAGLLINNDLYMFSGGLHDDALDALSRKGVNGTVVKFRGDMTRQGKIEKISPTGGLVPTKTSADRKKLFDQMAKVYNHKIIQRYVDKNDPHSVMSSVRSYFSYEKAFDEFTQLMKSTFGK